MFRVDSLSPINKPPEEGEKNTASGSQLAFSISSVKNAAVSDIPVGLSSHPCILTSNTFKHTEAADLSTTLRSVSLSSNVDTLNVNSNISARNKIVDFLRGAITVNSLLNMFNTGDMWQVFANDDDPKLPSIDTLDENYNEIAALKSSLTDNENNFLKQMISNQFYAVHHTNASKDVLLNKNKELILYSRKVLEEKGGQFKKSTSEGDVKLFGTSDYIFFSLACGDVEHKKSRFGDFSYKFPLQLSNFDNAVFYMMDPIGWAPHNTKMEHLSHDAQLIVDNYAYKYFCSDKVPLVWRCTFLGRDNFLESIGLHLINLFRTIPSDERDKLLCSANDSQLINSLINKVFRPQVLVPRIAAFRASEYDISTDE